MGEVPREYRNRAEKEFVEHQAELFAIYSATERLEKAFIQDDIQASDYEAACERLITQYRTLLKVLVGTGFDLDSFKRVHLSSCPRAIIRLDAGIPATQEHGQRRAESAAEAAAVGQTTEDYIAFLDELELQSSPSVDALLPGLQSIISHLRAFRVPPDASLRRRLLTWQAKLNTLGASYELTSEEHRQLKFEVGQSYAEFKEFLKQGGRIE